MHTIASVCVCVFACCSRFDRYGALCVCTHYRVPHIPAETVKRRPALLDLKRLELLELPLDVIGHVLLHVDILLSRE